MKLTGRLFVRAENETEHRPWDSLTAEEIKKISEYLNCEAACSGGYRKVAQAAA